MPNVPYAVPLSSDRAERLLESMRTLRVLVVGDVMLDVYLRGSASRISPEAPVPVVRVSEAWRAPGGAANVAANIIALGAHCELIGSVGRDEAGRQLLGALRTGGIGTDGVRVCHERRTTVKTRLLVGHQQLARFDEEVDDDIGGDAPDALAAAIRRLAAAAHVIVLEDYDKGVLVEPVIDAALRAAAERGIPSIVDPKARRFFGYRGATVFKPNRTELAAAMRTLIDADDAAWLQRTRAELGCEHLLVTLGEQGMALATAAGGHVRIASAALPVFDVSGAGDTVSAVVALALAAGASIEEAALLANHAAGIEVGKAGVATVSPDELRAAVCAADNIGRRTTG